MYSFLVALQFLTRIPSPIRGPITLEELGASIIWFPFVGAALGAFLVALDTALRPLLAPALTNALLVAALVAVTGALHLDGLVDSVDGFVTEGGAAARLEAMRQAGAGAAGATAACILLLAVYAALAALPEPNRIAALFLAPLCGRSAILAGYRLYPYARAERSFSRALKEGATTGRAVFGLAAAAFIALAVAGAAGLGLLALALLCMHGVAGLARRRLGGLTGDVHGAICETAQLAVLVAAPALHHP